MKYPEITNPLFHDAVEAIDAGDIAALQKLLDANPQLATERLVTPGQKGYFANPYLLWFIADNPIRIEKLPENIVEVTKVIIRALQMHGHENYQHIMDYTVGLVATGRVPKECAVQIPLMKLLVEEGAHVQGSVLGTIGQHNFEAAEFLLSKGSDYTLATAVGLNKTEDVRAMLKNASAHELYLALLVASFFGKADLVALLLEEGADPNGWTLNPDFGGFHSHASALHQAVCSGSVSSVKLLAEKGASLNTVDRIHNGTPLDWAVHMQTDGHDMNARNRFKEIESYLRTQHAREAGE